MCENAFLENLLKSSRNQVGILLDSRSLVGIGGGVKSTVRVQGAFLKIEMLAFTNEE
jgi:hypothetical protein